MISDVESDALRRKAEEALRDEDMPHLVHELRVHQIELELQNEELRDSRAKAEQSLAMYRELYDSAPIAYLSIDKGGTIRRRNYAAALALGREPLEGKKLRALFAAESGASIDAFIAKAFASCSSESLDAPSSAGEGAVPSCYHIVGAGKGEGADECLVALVDITERERSREELSRGAREKAALMRELEHRVKNNLNVVYSLLGIGQGQIEDVKAIAVLEKSRARIMAMSHIYEQLYQTDGVLEVDLWLYLEHLIEPLLETYAVDSSRFRLVKEFHSVTIDAQRAALAGLIFSELISNATKYAYPPDESGELRVSLLERDGAIELCVADDGVGLPEGFDYTTSGSMGFTMLRMLSEQMRAELFVESRPKRGVTTKLRILP